MRAPPLLLALLVVASGFGARGARAQGEARRVTVVEVDVDRPRRGEREQLERYMGSFLGAPATDDTGRRAEETLLRLERYRSAVCRVGEQGGGARLKCGLARARTIRSVRIEGLPWQLLETDLRKRIFLRPGEALDRADASGRDRVSRQRERIEDYLERQGFYGARVEVLTPPVSRTADVDVEVRISGGSFVRVREVRVESWLPLDRKELEDRLSGMCRSVDGVLAAFDTGELACYTRERLRETTERYEARLREDGFPEGRVQVESHFIDPTEPGGAGPCYATEDEILRYQAERLEVPPRCVDLDVRVRSGPRLVASLVLHEGPVGEAEAAPDAAPDADPPRAERYDAFSRAWDWGVSAVSSWFLDGVSRTLQSTLSLDLRGANDTDLRAFELEQVLTFAAASSTDETEAEISRRALIDALARRGYFNARVEMTRSEPGPDRVEVRYDIWPGDPVAIGEVHLSGNHAFSDEALLDAVELAARTRSLRHDGFVTVSDLDDDVVRLRSFYEARGYRDANVSWRAVQVSRHRMDVVFHIDEGGTRYQIAGLRLHGGVPELLPRMLQAMRHCADGLAKREGRAPSTLGDCKGNPLLPDELEADAQRVLNVYAAAGYPYANARVELSQEWTDEGPYLDVRIWPEGWEPSPDGEATEPPPPTRVERGVVFIEGNTKTDRGVILKEMGVDEDKDPLLDPVEISKGVSRLRRTGVFSRVGFDYIGVKEHSDQVHLMVQLEEKPTLTLDTALGFSTDNLFVTRLELRDRNFLGRMLDVGGLVDLGLFVGRFSQAQLRLRWPRILGSNVDLTVQPAVVYSDTPSEAVPRTPGKDGVVDAVPSWSAPDLRRRLFTAGASVGLEWRPLPETLPGLTTGVSYEIGVRYDNPAALRVPVFSERAFTTVDGLLEVFTVDEQRYGFVAPRVSYSSLTNPFDPDEGWTGDVTLRLGSPWLGGEESFLLATARATAYVPLREGTTLALNGRLWWGASDLAGNGTSALLSPELMLLGGDRTVRGFNATGLFGPGTGPFGLVGLPAELSDPGNTREGLNLVGGQVNVELRQTLIDDFFLGDVKGAVFFDAGLVTDDLSQPWLDPLALYDELVTKRLAADPREPALFGAAVGVGLRYVLPVGPMSLDLAFSPTHQQFGVHFQFGYAF